MPLSVAEIAQKNLFTGRGYEADGRPRSFTAQEFFEISIEAGWTQLDARYRFTHQRLARWLVRRLGVASTLEIGAGPGYLLHCLAQLGVDARGFDGNPFSQAFFNRLHPEHADRYLHDPLFTRPCQPVDALLSIEVFEHIPDAALDTIMTRVRDEVSPRFIVFSSTPHHDPTPHFDFQWGHINLKPQQAWDALFARFGFHPAPRLKPPVTRWARLYRSERAAAQPR